MGALTAVFCLFAANGFVLAALLAAQHANRVANRLLAGLVALVSLRLCIYAIGFAGLYDAHPWLTFLPLDLSAAFAPLLFLYVAALTAGLPDRWRRHLAPGALQLGYQFACFLLPMPAKWEWYAGPHLHRIEPAATVAIVLQCYVYTAAAWRRRDRYERWLDDRYGNREQWRLGWLRVMLVAFLLALTGVSLALAWSLLVRPLDYAGRVPAMLGFAVLAYVLGLLGWRHGATSFPRQDELDESPEPRAARVDYPATVGAWRRKTEAAGWWREEGLTVADLAGRLCVSERTLSRGLREGGGGNFNLFVNALRVAAVQRAILAGDRQDLLGLALECGFSSKASFNRAFRAVTGVTPSAWRRAAQIPPIDGATAI